MRLRVACYANPQDRKEWAAGKSGGEGDGEVWSVGVKEDWGGVESGMRWGRLDWGEGE